MKTDNDKSSKEIIENFIKENQLEVPDKDRIFKISFNEAWFSNTLAWLLDPKGSHKLKAKFADKFLQKIAQTRISDSDKYTRKETQLKWGKKGKGKSSIGIRLKKAAVIREFYLAKSIKKRNGKEPKYCDIAFFDLDPSVRFCLIVENKLFSSNHKHQLENYYDATKKYFRGAKILEYVYLTLNGSKPTEYEDESSTKIKNWVRMSWNEDILAILNELKSKDEHLEVQNLRHLLGWLKNLYDKSIIEHIEKLRTQLIESHSNCLLEELRRLNKTGKWKIKRKNSKSVTIKHSSFPAKPLYVESLPNLSVTVHSRRNGNALFRKIVIPYGLNTFQIYHSLDEAARKVYHYNFNGNIKKYKGKKRLRKWNQSNAKTENKEFFDFVHKNRNELQLIFAMSDSIRMAKEFEFQESRLN